MTAQHAIAVKKIAEWNKRLKINYRDLFIDLGKTIIHGVTGAALMDPSQLIGVIKNAFGAYKTLKGVSLSEMAEEPGQVAWALIHRSLIQAAEDLVAENITLLAERSVKQAEDPDPVVLGKALAEALDETEVFIDEGLFSEPKALPVVDAFQGPFAAWLQGLGFSQAQAESIAERLPSHFVFALHHEWGRRPSDYEDLEAALKTPLMGSSRQEQAWKRYRSHLQKQVNERLFNEAFGLNKVYVPPRAYYEIKEKKAGKADNRHKDDRTLLSASRPPKKKVVVLLREALVGWFSREDPKDAIRILSGGPGSGKSSFAKMFAARLAEKNPVPIRYVPLHHFEFTGDLEQDVGAFVRDADLLRHNPLGGEKGEPRLLIIFDGLDELGM